LRLGSLLDELGFLVSFERYSVLIIYTNIIRLRFLILIIIAATAIWCVVPLIWALLVKVATELVFVLLNGRTIFEDLSLAKDLY
jgi:hypothetical protein